MDRLRWLVSLPLLNGIQGAVYQYLKTGTLPKSLLESQFPAIGGGQHAANPGYFDKDFTQWAKILNTYGHDGVIKGLQATGGWVLGRGNPAMQTLHDFLFGEDAIGNKVGVMPMESLRYPFNQPGVFHAGDPGHFMHWILPKDWAQYASNLWGHVEPIFLQMQSAAKGASKLNLFDRMLGMREAPTWIEDALNGTNKYQSGRDYREATDAYEQSKRFARENAASAEPVPYTPLPRPGSGQQGDKTARERLSMTHAQRVEQFLNEPQSDRVARLSGARANAGGRSQDVSNVRDQGGGSRQGTYRSPREETVSFLGPTPDINVVRGNRPAAPARQGRGVGRGRRGRA